MAWLRGDSHIPPPPDMAANTEDEAIQTIGFFDAMATQNLRDLAGYEAKLVKEIDSKTNALAAVREAMERGKALLPYDPADDSRKSYDAAIEAKRKRGDKHFPAKVEAAA
jgi:hypothetical protein